MTAEFKVALLTDLEGVACVTDPVVWNSGDSSGVVAEYRRLFIGEVNAAVAAAFDSGATEVLVHEGHKASLRGHIEDLDPRAKIALSVPFEDVAALAFDALILVGYHSMADAEGGVLSHTFADRAYVAAWLNGTLIGEIGHLAALFGAFSTPLLFVSGDQAACREAEDLVDGVVTAPVKQAAGRFGALSLSPHAARTLIALKVREALTDPDRARPLSFDPPVELVVEFSTTDPVERNILVPGIEPAGPRRILIRGDSVVDVMKLFALTGRIV